MPRYERPLDWGEGDDDVLTFAAGLRGLRQAAGNPPYRELSRRAHYSAGALSDAAGGRKLPSLSVTVAYVRACEGDVGAWERRWHEVAAARAAATARAEDDGTPAPYPGLDAFQSDDSDRFFGRERLTDELLARVSSDRLVAVVGPSGVGKSSLLRAGLVAGARDRPWTVLLFTPGAEPLRKCAEHAAGAVGDVPARLHEELRADPRGLHRTVLRALAGQSPDGELLLVVDQFEEVFTRCHDDTERAGFTEALIVAARAADSRCRIVLGVRADVSAHHALPSGLVPAVRDHPLTVGPMSADELRLAIIRPAAEARCAVEGALLAALVAQASGPPGALPLLAHALRETWHRRRGNTLTLTGFQAVGGIDGTLARIAENAYGTLPPGRRERARNVLLRLVAPGGGAGEDTPRRIRRSDLDAGTETAEVLDALARARLLTLGDDRVEIAHASLVRGWPRLRDWLAENREGGRVHHRLAEAAGDWEALDRDAGALYRGTRLAVAREWAARRDTSLLPRERGFLEASIAAEERERSTAGRAARRFRRLVGVLVVLLALTVGATVVAVQEADDAARQRNATLSRQIADAARALRTAKPALAVQLGLAAYRHSPGPEARGSLLSSFATPYATRLTGHRDVLRAVDFSPDGRVLATAGADAVRLWDVGERHRARQLTTLTGPDLPRGAQELMVSPGRVEVTASVAFSADGTLLATAGEDHIVRLWNVTDPRRPVKAGHLAGHTGVVTSLAFSPAGRTLATAGADRTVRLWDLSRPARPGQRAVLADPTGITTATAFSPDGRTLAVAGSGRAVRLWDVGDPGEPARLAVLPGRGTTTSVAFAPGGMVLATAGADRTVRLWDVTDPRDPASLTVLSGHTDAVLAVAFSPDRTMLVTTSGDRTARLWNVADPRRPRELATLSGHIAGVVSAAFSPDGRSVATVGDDQTARLWDIPAPTLSGHGGPVYGVTFDRSGQRLVSVGRDRVARLWNVADPGRVTATATLGGAVHAAAASPAGATLATVGLDRTARLWSIRDPGRPVGLATLTGHTDEVYAAAFRPDGRLLATAGDDRTVRLWDLAGPNRSPELAELSGHTDSVGAVAFSPDGRTAATASWDRTARLWDVTDPRRPRELATLRHTHRVQTVAFSPRGGLLATAGDDRTVRLWDVRGGGGPRQLSALPQPATINAVAFAPDGRTLASAGQDSGVRLWDLETPHRPTHHATLTGHTDTVQGVTFSPDGRRLATASNDTTVRLWDLDVERVARRICRTAHPPVTPAQWSRYVRGLPYSPPCGS
ncbi:hypothetical protein [Streptomyces sp. NPDC020965]|uniref:nSTAND1 domain-containing NTPase n=1 Tax=Streptomyces sp. NPDC020965 TaxID=3365105 RepID=UPI003794D38A